MIAALLVARQLRRPGLPGHPAPEPHAPVLTVVAARSGRKPWTLHDLDTDPAEAKDLAAEMPEKVKEMVTRYEKWYCALRN